MKKFTITFGILLSFLLLTGITTYYFASERKTSLPKQTQTQISTNNGETSTTNYLDEECPFFSTVVTSGCLDDVLERKEKEVEELVNSLTQSAQTRIEEIESGSRKGETIGYSSLLSGLTDYGVMWKSYRNARCSLELAFVTGTAIMEDIRKCQIRETDEYIQILKGHKIRL